MGKNQKGKKMSMAEFMGGTPSREVDLLPSGPKQRGPDDDGSFRRNNNSMRDSNRGGGGGSRNYNGRRDDGDPGRGDEEQNWRRGGGGMQQSGGGRDSFRDRDRGGDSFRDRDRGDNFRDRDRGDNFRDRDRGDSFRDRNRGDNFDSGRGDEEQNWRRGGGMPQKEFSREDGGRSGHNRDIDDGPPSRADGDTSWRSGRSVPPPPPPSRNSDRYGQRDDPYSSRSGSYRSSAPVERERPKLQLSKRTLPVENKPAKDGDTSSSGDKKDDPFGGAKAADTASKLSALGIKDDKKEENTEDEEKRPPAMPINSRAAALEAAPRASRDNSDPRDDNRSMRRSDGYDRNRGNDSRSFRNRDDRGPYDNRDRGGRDDRGPYDNRGDRWGRDDRGHYDNRDRGGRDDRGPYDNRDRRGRDDRGSYDNRDRGGYDNRSYRGDRDRQSRSHSSYDQQDRRSNRAFDDVRRNDNSDDYPRRSEDSSFKTTSSGSRKEEAFPPLASPPSDPVPPNQEQTSTTERTQKTKVPEEKSKAKEDKEKEADSQMIKKEEEEKKRQVEELEKQKKQEELLEKFVSLKDDALLDFCKDNESTLGIQIESLTNSLFKEKKDASWTSTHKSAFQYLIPPDNMSKQLDVLFAIQKYCHSINFPKENDKNVIHTYFELMLAEDIVSYESFFEWKDDEQKAHELGKTKAIIQTMDWFTFLENMMAGDDDEEYGDDEEYEDDF